MSDMEVQSKEKLAYWHIVQEGFGGGGAVFDRLWRIEADGARTAIEIDFTIADGEAELRAEIFLPGRLDLPVGVAAGDSWTSEGEAHTWVTGSGYESAGYRAEFTAGTGPRDAC